MANINITSDAWTEISITSGTVQNISATADIELSAEQTDNSGVVLKPSEIYQWDNETIYARAVTEDTGALRVVNFKRAAGGGGYVLPVASASTLGGVKVGSNLSIDASGVLSANAGGYTLPPATTSTLGGVIVGDNVTVDANGEISVAAPYSLPTATANDLGGVKIGSNITIDANGAISAPAAYTLPTASNSTLGGIKIGQNLFIDASGVLSAPVSYSTTEQIIGTWIDGKPVYQKTYSGTLSNDSYTDFTTHDTNINMIQACGYIYGPEGGASPIAVGGMLNSNYYCGVFSDYQLFYSDQYKNGTYNITIQYTKTTD